MQSYNVILFLFLFLKVIYLLKFIHLRNVIYLFYFIIRHLIIDLIACSILLNWILITCFTFLIHFNDSMSYILIVKRFEHIMDLAVYKINILLLLLKNTKRKNTNF